MNISAHSALPLVILSYLDTNHQNEDYLEPVVEWILENHCVDYTKWTKSVKNLCEELLKGESTLLVTTATKVGVLERHTRVSLVNVYYQEDLREYRLYESEQVTSRKNGEIFSKRRGHRHLSEKVWGSEDPLIGACRGIKEELGLSIASSRLKVGDILIDRDKPSTSYIGLQCVYNLFHYHVVLQSSEYRPGGYVETQIDLNGNKTDTIFKWSKDM